MAARAADVAAYTVLPGQDLLWELAQPGNMRRYRKIPTLKLNLDKVTCQRNFHLKTIQI